MLQVMYPSEQRQDLYPQEVSSELCQLPRRSSFGKDLVNVAIRGFFFWSPILSGLERESRVVAECKSGLVVLAFHACIGKTRH